MKQKWKFWKYIASSTEILYGVISMMAALVLNDVANAVTLSSSASALLWAGLKAVLFGAAYAGSRFLADGLTQVYAEKRAAELRSALNEAIFSMNSEQFSRQDTGNYLNLVVQDVLLLKQQRFAHEPLLYGYAAQFIFCVIYSFYLAPHIALLLCCASVIQYVVPGLFGKRINRRMLSVSKQNSVFSSKLKELYLGFGVIQGHGAGEVVMPEFEQANDALKKTQISCSLMQQGMMKCNLLLSWTSIVCAVVLTGLLVIQGRLPVGTILTVFYIANRFSMPIIDFTNSYTSIKGSLSVFSRLNQFLADYPILKRSQTIQLKTKIELENVSFSYDKKTPALKNVSCRFMIGEKILLLGESGCGKSTLLKLIAGLYPAKGIMLDGIDRQDYAYGQLEGRIILVQQQPYLFHRTIRDNIDFKQTKDTARLDECLKMARLKEWVDSLPEGADTFVDEEMFQLSGGQKARIALARALYSEPDVLLLDEVTSALDAESALAIEEMLLRLKDTLVIHISHKPSEQLKKEYDQIITMEKGEIIAVKKKADH